VMHHFSLKRAHSLGLDARGRELIFDSCQCQPLHMMKNGGGRGWKRRGKGKGRRRKEEKGWRIPICVIPRMHVSLGRILSV
jgi:hypothetical protein